MHLAEMNNVRPHRRRKVFLLAAAALIALLVCLAHSTEHPEVPYRVMPESATVASDHLDVRGRWRDFVLLPAVSNALEAADVDVLEFRDEPGWRILIPLTTGRNTVLALTPEYGTDGQPVLWGASFAGWRRLVLRFLLATRWIPGLGRLEIAPNGSRYLQLGSKRHPSDWKVGFAMRDNVLLAALSTDGDAVQALEKRAEEKAEPAAVYGTSTPWEGAGTRLHRFWIGDPLVRDALGAPLTAWISEIDRDRFSVGARLPRPEALADYLAEGDRLTGVNAKASALAADSAYLLLLAPQRPAVKWLNGLLFPNGNARTMKEKQAGDAVAYLTASPYHGSLFGVRIPALTVLCPGVLFSREELQAAVTRLTGNARYPQVLGGEDQKSRVLVPIRWQKGNALFKTFPEEYGVVELNRISHGFTFCSARMSYDAQQKADTAAKAPWHDWLAPRLAATEGGTPVAFLWIDLGPVADEARQILALTRIASLAGVVRFEPEETARINALGAFLRSFNASGRLALLVSDDGGGFLRAELALL